MQRRMAVTLIGLAATAAVTVPSAWAGGHQSVAARTCGGGYEPVLDPTNFTRTIDNPLYPLPVGRELIYHGVKDGETQIDRVTVTSQTKVLEGITATVVTDVATHHSKLLEKTQDWFAQDKQGNVWYLGENTKAYLPDGTVDTSGSWRAGVNDAEPGIIMEAAPKVPDAYRQECSLGQAEDTAWVVRRGGHVTVPYGHLAGVMTSLEATRIEPGSYDKKVYAKGIGIVVERSLTSTEWAKLTAVKG